MSGKPDWEPDIIGRASDLIPAGTQILSEALPKETIHPLVSLEELERPSPRGAHPDPEFPDLDTRDPLYIPRFLIRRWGGERFLRSPYYKLWETEAGRGKRLADPKPGQKK